MIERLIEILEETNELHETSKSLILDECPWCGKSNKLYIVKEEYSNGYKEYKPGQFICWVCNEAGQAPKLIAQIKDISWHEAKTLLGHNDVYTEKEDKVKVQKKVEIPYIPLPDDCIDLRQTSAEAGFNYTVIQRDVSLEQAAFYGLKYRAANSRVYIPINHGEYVAGWQARLIYDDENQKKILFPKGIAGKEVLMGFNEAKKNITAVGALTIVEGPFDMLKATYRAYGIYALATMGKNYGEGQIEHIIKLCKEVGISSVYCGYDLDAPEAAYKLCRDLTLYNIKVFTFKSFLGYDDIGDIPSAKIPLLYAEDNVTFFDFGG